MFVHEDSRILASAGGGELAIYDVAQNKLMARILPPGEPNSMRRDKNSSTFGLFSSQRKLSQVQMSGRMSSMSSATVGEDRQPKVISLTMHQMRLVD